MTGKRNKVLSPIRLTTEEHDFLAKEAKESCNSISGVARKLINEEMRRQNHESTKAALFPRQDLDS